MRYQTAPYPECGVIVSHSDVMILSVGVLAVAVQPGTDVTATRGLLIGQLPEPELLVRGHVTALGLLLDDPGVILVAQSSHLFCMKSHYYQRTSKRGMSTNSSTQHE